MTMKRPLAVLLPLAVACALPMIAAAQSAPAPPARPQQPITAEKNPPGDIPDNQAFVAFKSPLGFAVKAPEGWARRELPNGVSFSDKYNELQVAVASAATAPTLPMLQAGDIAVLEKSLRALRAVAVLEDVGSREAKAILETLAGGVPDARLTREAKAALRRMGHSPATAP